MISEGLPQVKDTAIIPGQNEIGASQDVAIPSEPTISVDTLQPEELTYSQPEEQAIPQYGITMRAEGEPKLQEASEVDIMRWRYRVLPTMQRILYIVTAIFFVLGLLQLGYLQWSILQGTKIDRQELPSIIPLFGESLESELLDAAKFEATMIMESYVVERRYHQANTLLMTMAWIRYLGFATGMILAIVGASFILGMLHEKQTDLSAKSAEWQFSLVSSSPGLIMVVLGVMLMFTTITSRQNFDLQDRPVYFETNPSTLDLESTQEATRQALSTPDHFSEE
jgi:hypothetical protein